MTLWPTELELDGVTIPLRGVLADLTIRHGRDGADGDPIASSAAIALEPVDRALTAPFTVGRPVRLLVGEGSPIVEETRVSEETVGDVSQPRFVGTITDAELDVDRLSLTAIGPLAGASRFPLDVTGWVAEPWSARCARVFAAAGVPATVEADPDFDPVLEVPAADPGELLLGSYLRSLAYAVGAAIRDGPDGVIVCQALGARAHRAAPLLELDPAKVAYAPLWTQTLEVSNDVTVEYGPDAATSKARATDVVSAGEYGSRAYPIDSTRIRSAADADIRARTALARRAYPRWVMPAAPVLEPIVLHVGDRVSITELPPASPRPAWEPLLEGWEDRIDGPAWTMALALSDPLYSGLALTWADVDAGPALAWTAVDPATAWLEALELEAL